MVIVVPLYEEEETGVYYNTAAVIDADGTYLGKYRKNHIPHTAPGLLGEVLLQARATSAIRCSRRKYADVGVYICYDRHFPEGARELGLNGAEIVFNPSATVAGLSEYLWKLEQPAHAVANALLRRRDQSRRLRGAVEHRRVLRPELLLRSARPVPGAGARATRTS